uniref:ATP synthase subunit a n=1 Tax=Hydra sinensis TaxID=570418 RepID=R4IXA1_9CNID|nr:ATP synthase F0 subunit 6 [Hydra sinensis]AGE65894.1 ATP synthase F0 subunit 6 [Hydra sinensis]
MASYFDHFLLTKIIFSFLFDPFIILIIILILNIIILKFNFLIPSRLQVFFEKLVDHFFQISIENLGKNSQLYTLFLFSIFLYICIINLMGFLIFCFPITTHISLTFGLAFFIWLAIKMLGFLKYKFLFFSIFMPSGAPLILSPLLIFIEFASHISRPIALGMRLAANLTAGHILLTILSDFFSKMFYSSIFFYNLFPIFIIIFMIILELGVLIIQAYVFMLLCLIYLKDSLILH